VKTAWPEVAWNGGERWRSEPWAPSDWRAREVPSGCRLAEEEEGVKAELLAVSAERGDERNGGEVRRPARVWAARAQRGGEKEGEAKWGFSPGRRRPL
jgi:hypothetical protein